MITYAFGNALQFTHLKVKTEWQIVQQGSAEITKGISRKWQVKTKKSARYKVSGLLMYYK